jgi:hypothetical protein
MTKPDLIHLREVIGLLGYYMHEYPELFTEEEEESWAIANQIIEEYLK